MGIMKHEGIIQILGALQKISAMKITLAPMFSYVCIFVERSIFTDLLTSNLQVTISNIHGVTTSVKEFNSLKQFASLLKAPLSPDPTG